MGRTEYMAELESRLQSLPEEERKAALNYYEEYFNEAGVQRERNAIDELGPPAKIAAQILADVTYTGAVHAKPKKKLSALVAIAIGIFAVPVGLPLAMAGFMVLLAVILCVFSVVLALGIAFLGVLFSGGVLIYSGLTLLTVSFGSACMYGGLGCVLIGISLFLFAAAKLAGRYLLSGILNVASGIFNNLKGRVAA